MFCVECGKETTIFKDGVCIDCYLKTHNFTKGPKIIDIPICTHCNSYKIKNIWTNELFSDVIKRIIKNTFKISKQLKKIDINTDCKEEKERITCKVFISGFLEKTEITEEHEIIVRLKKTVCDVCSKRFGGYHEAIIQIRADKRDLSKQEINDIVTNVEVQVENLVAKGNRSLFITDIGIEHGGLDFFLSDKGAALTITNKIQDKYGGEIKQSSKNMGMKDSRQIYRMTYLLRLSPYKKDDTLKIKNKFYKIRSISKNKIKMIDLSNWEEILTDTKSIKKSNIIQEDSIDEMIIVSQTKNEIQIMNPDTYKIKIVKKPKKINFPAKKIKTITIEEQIYLYPNKT